MIKTKVALLEGQLLSSS